MKIKICPNYLEHGCWEKFTTLSGGIRYYDCNNLDKITNVCKKGYTMAFRREQIPTKDRP